MAKKKKAKKVVIPAKYFEAVEAGVKFLDMTVGRKQWLRQMDMKLFDIENPDTCVAGNVFQEAYFEGSTSGYNSFVSAVNALGGNGDKKSEEFGFSSNSQKGWQYLQDIWVHKIKRLKAAH